MPQTVSVVVPARNEAPSLGAILDGCAPHADELLLIDGHSTDGTRAIAQERGVRVLCDDGTERMGVLRGSMRKRVWVRRGDIVLVTLREYEDAKADIVHKYNETEVSRLASMKEIPDTIMKYYVALDGEEVEDTGELEYFTFAEEDSIDAI